MSTRSPWGCPCPASASPFPGFHPRPPAQPVASRAQATAPPGQPTPSYTHGQAQASPPTFLFFCADRVQGAVLVRPFVVVVVVKLSKLLPFVRGEGGGGGGGGRRGRRKGRRQFFFPEKHLHASRHKAEHCFAPWQNKLYTHRGTRRSTALFQNKIYMHRGTRRNAVLFQNKIYTHRGTRRSTVLFQNKIYTHRGTRRSTVLFDIPGAYGKCGNPIISLSIYPPA